MKKLAIILAILALSACGAADRGMANLTGFSESCISGVAYYQFPSGVTVAYLANGSIKTCQK